MARRACSAPLVAAFTPLVARLAPLVAGLATVVTAHATLVTGPASIVTGPAFTVMLAAACSGRPAPPPTTVVELPEASAAGAAPAGGGPGTASPDTGAASDSVSPYSVRELAAGVYAVPGDAGRGVEGRANAGFIVTGEGVVVVDALGSPRQGERLLAAIRRVTAQPVRWLVLTHHHPDHQFGAAALARAGARVVAHPDDTMQAAGESDSALVADWRRVVGDEEMRGFAFANEPDVPVTADTTLVLAGREIVISHPGTAHTPGDLTVWLPAERVLFAGDLLVEDGVTMLNDGDSRVLLDALETLGRLRPQVVVPGHGAIPPDARALAARTVAYVEGLRAEMRRAFDAGESLNAVVAALPEADPDRPVSRESRKRRNAVRVYLEIEREAMGLGGAAPPAPPAATLVSTEPPPATLVSTEELQRLTEAGGAVLIDARTDVAAYLANHLPGAVYLNTETLRAGEGGVPNLLLPLESYRTLFSRLGVTSAGPVVVYSAGEARNIDATYVAWILSGLGHADVRVLDGGYGKWELEARPLTRRYPHFEPTRFEPRAFRPERATLDDVRRSMARDDVVLVDARPPDQYAGQAGAQVRRGHIPGAVNHYWQTDLVEGEFARVWKPAGEIRAAYEAQGITPDREVIAYCNGGLESSHVYFTLRNLLGYPRVRVYDGSWTEWSEREDLPLETGPASTAPAAASR